MLCERAISSFRRLSARRAKPSRVPPRLENPQTCFDPVAPSTIYTQRTHLTQSCHCPASHTHSLASTGPAILLRDIYPCRSLLVYPHTEYTACIPRSIPASRQTHFPCPPAWLETRRIESAVAAVARTRPRRNAATDTTLDGSDARPASPTKGGGRKQAPRMRNAGRLQRQSRGRPKRRQSAQSSPRNTPTQAPAAPATA